MKRMGKWLGLLLLLFVFLPDIGIYAGAGEIPKHSAEETAEIPGGSCGDGVFWTFDRSEGTLFIRGNGPMGRFGYQNQPWKKYIGSVRKVILEEGITSIANYAFAQHSALECAVLPESLTEIGSFGFYICPELTVLQLPGGLTAIRPGTFYGCSSLTELIIPEGVTYIGSDSLENCRNLVRITIPSTVTTIGNTAFAGCTALTEVQLPSGLEKLGGGAFFGCTGLTGIMLPRTLTVIEDHTFYGCSGLRSVCIPDRVTKIGYYAFYGCRGLSQICFTGNAPVMDTQAFTGMQSSVYYPGDDDSWTAGMQKGYGGQMTWQTMARPEMGNDQTTGKPLLKWGSLPGAVSYQIWRSETVSGEFVPVQTGIDTNYMDSEAEPDCNSYYKIKVTFANGCTAFGSIHSAVCRLPAPRLTLANEPASGKPRLDWETVEGAQEYQICRSTSKNGEFTRLKTTRDLEYVDISAVAACTYFYEIRAIHANSRANSAFSAAKSQTCDLMQPVVTIGEEVDSGKIRLRWEPVEGAKKYRVYRSDGQSGYETLQDTNHTAYTDTRVVGGQRYSYKVRAVSSVSSAHSVTSKAVTGICGLAQPEVSLSNSSSSGKIQLSWKAVDGAASYRIYRKVKEGSYSRLEEVSAPGYQDDSAQLGKVYYYKVKAVSADGSLVSASSATRKGSCDLARPVVRAKNVEKTGKISLTWDQVEGAVKYRVYRAVKNGSYKKLVDVTATAYTDITAAAGKTYSYKVKAMSRDSEETSASSSAVSLVCDLARPVVSIKRDGSGDPTVYWKAVSGAKKYRVYRADSETGPYTTLKTTTKCTFTDTSAQKGVTYYYKVRAMCTVREARSVTSPAKSIRVK